MLNQGSVPAGHLFGSVDHSSARLIHIKLVSLPTMFCFPCLRRSNQEYVPPRGSAGDAKTQAPPCEAGEASRQAQRVFPFQDSYLDIWDLREYLDRQLGKNCYDI